MSTGTAHVISGMLGSIVGVSLATGLFAIVLWIQSRNRRWRDLRDKNDEFLDSVDDLLKRPRK